MTIALLFLAYLLVGSAVVGFLDHRGQYQYGDILSMAPIIALFWPFVVAGYVGVFVSKKFFGD